MVRIRMKRMGRRHRPFFRINAIEKRAQRDGRVIEPLGWYDPQAKDDDKRVELNAERIKYWISQGAQPSETVKDLLAKHEIIDPEQRKAEREARYVRKRDRIAEEKKAEAEAASAAAAAASAEPSEPAESSEPTEEAAKSE